MHCVRLQHPDRSRERAVTAVLADPCPCDTNSITEGGGALSAVRGREGPGVGIDHESRRGGRNVSSANLRRPVCLTIVAMSSEPPRAVRDHLSEVVDRVEREHERVTITGNGRDAAVLTSPDDLAGLEETLAVLSDPAALEEIREADAATPRATWCAAWRPFVVLPNESGSDAPYELVLTAPARRALTDRLPEAVAGAVIEFLTTTLIEQSRRVGKPLPSEVAGVRSGRRGTYRLNEQPHEMIALRIEHRANVYRPR